MQEPDYPDPNFQAIISEGYFLRQNGRYEQAWERLEDLEPIDRHRPGRTRNARSAAITVHGSGEVGNGREHPPSAGDCGRRVIVQVSLKSYFPIHWCAG